MNHPAPHSGGPGIVGRPDSSDDWLDPETTPLPVYRDRDLAFAPLAVQRERAQPDAATPGELPPLGARNVRSARPTATTAAGGAATLTAPVTGPGTAAETPPRVELDEGARVRSSRRTFLLGLVVGALVIVAVLAVLLAGGPSGLPGAPGAPGAVPGGVTSMLPGHGAPAAPRAGG